MSCVFKFQWGETILSLTPDRRHRRARRQALCAWPRGDLVYSSYGSWFPHRPTSGHGAHRVVYSMDLTSVGIRALVQPFAGSTPPHDRLGRDKLLCARTLFRYMGLGPPYWHRLGGATHGPIGCQSPRWYRRHASHGLCRKTHHGLRPHTSCRTPSEAPELRNCSRSLSSQFMHIAE